MDIVEKIQLLCESKNITVGMLEKELGLSKAAVYKWHKSSPKVDSLQKVAKYFGVTIESLLADIIPVEDISNLDEETKKIVTNPEAKPYILLTKKALDKGIPIEVLETLIDVYAKK